MHATAYCLQGEKLVCGSPEDFFPFFDGQRHVISLVGGGGKTTTLYYLATCFGKRGVRTAVMTTTKMGRPRHLCTNIAECRACWEAGAYAVCGEDLGNGKISAPAERFLSALQAEADVLLIEADGSRGLPCKAPAAHEPVLLPETDVVIGVMGLDALDKPVGDICLRAEIVQQLLGCDAQHLLTEEDMAKILLSAQGTRKNVGERDFFIVLNKCDDAVCLSRGQKLLSLLQRQGHTQGMLTCGMQRSETYEYDELA